MRMRSLFPFLAGLFATAFRPRLSLQLEVAALRQQLPIYREFAGAGFEEPRVRAVCRCPGAGRLYPPDENGVAV
jgi:hypothetical protein